MPGECVLRSMHVTDLKSSPWAAGAVVAPTLINVAPTGVALGATGAGVSPTLIRPSFGPMLLHT